MNKKSDGYFLGSKTQWKKSWMFWVSVVIVGLVIAVFTSFFLGGIIMALGLFNFSENYYSGIGNMGFRTYKKPKYFFG